MSMARFVERGGHLWVGDAMGICQQSEPIFGFFNFFQAVTDFGNEFGF
jgi:hypothetical protein